MSITLQQRTLVQEVTVSGIGFIWGSDVTLRFLPADPDSGVTFVRTDLPGQPQVPAQVQWVARRQRRTTLQTSEANVEMVEHVLAALAGLWIDNCTIEIDAPETPGCDGSSVRFVEALLAAGIAEQPALRPVVELERPYWVRDGEAYLVVCPSNGRDLAVGYNLDYGAKSVIGRQSFFAHIEPDLFTEELAPARTFLLKEEADALRAQGLGSRTSARDLLIFGPEGPIENYLRFPNEPVRHKILDIVGDLSLIGSKLVGHVLAYKSGHRLNVELARRLAQTAVRQPRKAA